jgi:hypothetical protein
MDLRVFAADAAKVTAVLLMIAAAIGGIWFAFYTGSEPPRDTGGRNVTLVPLLHHFVAFLLSFPFLSSSISFDFYFQGGRGGYSPPIDRGVQPQAPTGEGPIVFPFFFSFIFV